MNWFTVAVYVSAWGSDLENLTVILQGEPIHGSANTCKSARARFCRLRLMHLLRTIRLLQALR